MVAWVQAAMEGAMGGATEWVGAAVGRGTIRSRGVLQGCAEFEGFSVMVQAGFLGEVGVQVEGGRYGSPGKR